MPLAIRYLVFLSALLAGLTAWAQAPTVQVYTLRHQLADNVRPVVAGILSREESVTAYNNELVVNAYPDTHAEVARLLQDIDRPMRNLWISVRNDRTGDSVGQSAGISGGIRTGEVVLGTGQPRYRDQGLIVQHDGLQGHVNRETRQVTTQQDQRLRAVEGYPAWISTGQAIPYRQVDRWGNAITDYRNADQGFYVTARVMGDRVVLDISTSDDKLSDDRQLRRHGVIETNRLKTSVSGYVGEWIRLGGIDTSENRRDGSYTSRDSSESSSLNDIAVMVVPAD